MNESNRELDAQILSFDAKQGERVLSAVHTFLGRFVSYPSPEAHVAHTLWCVHTHMMSQWESTPRIAFLSPEPGSGKSRALEITELLVPNPVLAVNMSPAYIFRKVGQEDGATILYDEIDTVFGPKARENEEIRGLLNAGHRKGAVAGRCVIKGKNPEPEEIEAYSAVALAGLGSLPDTILTRSIIVRMRRRHADQQIEKFRSRVHRPAGHTIRDMIANWARSVTIDNWSDLKMPEGVEDRDADVWEALIAIADVAGGKWPELARTAAVALVAASKEREPSLNLLLLTDLRTVFGNAEVMSSKRILAALKDLPESPWRDIKGKELDERGLARRLRSYEIRSITIREAGATPKGYKREDLADAWKRYLPPLAENSDTSATTPHDTVKCHYCDQWSGSLVEVFRGGASRWLHRECIDKY